MNWATRILSQVELEPYAAAPLAGNWPAQVNALLAQQQQTWPQLREATDGLQQVEYRRFNIKGAEVLAQFNPKRLVSTAAKVDAASIQARPCFLCVGNLPEEERGLPFGDDFVVLCNPFPVLPKHLVVTARQHTPQAVAASFGSLLDVTRALGADFFTLYNGPKCGASAPDHLHFQAAEATRLPLWRELERGPLQRWPSASAVETFTLPCYRINMLGAFGSDRTALLAWFERALSTLAALTESKDEPLLNLLATFNNGRWCVLLLPRQRHRPTCYDAEGDARLTISPAAIDLGGVLVVPQPEHFARLTAVALGQIYTEVTLRDDLFTAWLTQLTQD
ncbi:MAG: DUF4922 domain-containing protein [Acidobacteria bacterium]|nr:DUF4922 domain-containing protein [Acidobacteriota bacterium]MBI3427563.1 DUF4922 domain-containing protein [Acidobacteriota bacterium]